VADMHSCLACVACEVGLLDAPFSLRNFAEIRMVLRREWGHITIGEIDAPSHVFPPFCSAAFSVGGSISFHAQAILSRILLDSGLAS